MQHIYVKASVAPKFRHYSNVDDALNTLFGVGYETYRNKSDWISTKYGTIKYVIGTAMNNSDCYCIQVYFDPDNFDPASFRDLLKDAIDNDIHISAQYMNGNSGYGKEMPQINLRVKKVFPYDHETKRAIKEYLEELSNSYFDLDNKAECSVSTEAVNYIEYHLDCFALGSSWREEEYRRNRSEFAEWRSRTDVSLLHSFAATLPKSVVDTFSSVTSVKVTYISDKDYEIDLKVNF